MKKINFILLLFLSLSAFATPLKKQIKLVLRNTTSANLLADATSIYLDYGTSPTFITNEDSRKILNQANEVPQIYAFTSDGVPCVTTGFGLFTHSLVIRLGIRTDSTTDFILYASQLGNFDSTSIIQLEDRLTGTFFDLRQGDFAFQSAAGFSDQRFFLHISYPVTITATDADCSNTNGTVTVAQDSALTWTSIDLYTPSGTHLSALPASGGTRAFTGVAEGDYLVQLAYNNYVTYKTVHVTGNKITVAINAAAASVAPGAELQFYSTCSNASSHEWDFGDGTLITEVTNPTITYYEPGTYTVTLKCTNDYGCIENASMVVTVAEATGINGANQSSFKIFADHTNIVFDRGDNGSETKYIITNLIGQPVAAGSFDAGRFTVDLATQPDGVYIADVQGQGFRYSKKVYVRR